MSDSPIVRRWVLDAIPLALLVVITSLTATGPVSSRAGTGPSAPSADPGTTPRLDHCE